MNRKTKNRLTKLDLLVLYILAILFWLGIVGLVSGLAHFVCGGCLL